MVAAFDRAARSLGLSAAQACLLEAVAHEARTMGELATRLLCDASNVTQLVTRLETHGLVTREPDPRDRRTRRVAATAAGVELAGRVEEAFAFPGERLGRLSVEKRRRLSALLAEVLD